VPTRLLENLLLFGRVLKSAGIPVTLGQVLTFASALPWVDIRDREEFYHSARALLVHRREDLGLFRILFDRFWCAPEKRREDRPKRTPWAPRMEEKLAKRFTIVNYLASRAGENDPEIDVPDRSMAYTASESLQTRDLSELTPEELDAVRGLIQRMAWRVSERTTRRWVPDSRGRRIDLRKVLRESGRYGGTPVRLAYRRRKIKPRPIVLLADVSGSMERYSRTLLQFFYCVSQALGDVESFVFGTRLTRITPELRLRNVDRALDAASHEVVDWAGGTRIGESLHAFNRRWSRRVLRRGAIVVLVSDGWERGDVGVLREEIRYLQRRCHRLLWLNPLLGRSGYQPLVEGMAAALPFVDDFLPVHNLQSLEALAQRLAELGRGRRQAHRRPSSRSGHTVDESR